MDIVKTQLAWCGTFRFRQRMVNDVNLRKRTVDQVIKRYDKSQPKKLDVRATDVHQKIAIFIVRAKRKHPVSKNFSSLTTLFKLSNTLN